MILTPINERLFTVAILGRPNVGKSTLFNRLLGNRRAITDATPGVTRDAIESECRIDDLCFCLVDTGGYDLESGELERLVSARSERMGQEADLILLMVDVQGLTGADERFLERLRRLEPKLILVVNKVDGTKQETAMLEFYELGLSRLVGVSAEHNRNIDALRNIIYDSAQKSDFMTAVGPKSDKTVSSTMPAVIRLAILGKPNTGKSTLLNLILAEEKALVSEIPGTTRDTISGRFVFKQQHFRIMDTAGIRRKTKINDNVEYYSVNRAIKSIRESDVVYLLIESPEGLTDQDKKIAAQVVKKGRGIIIVLNKWDLMDDIPNQFQAVRDRSRFLFPIIDFAPILPLSALTGEGLPTLFNTTFQVYRQLTRRVDTSLLNRHLKKWMDRYALPVRGKNIKIRYATQASVNPVKFIFFVNHLKGFPNRYSQFLQNRIQEDLGFDKIPVSVEFREK